MMEVPIKVLLIDAIFIIVFVVNLFFFFKSEKPYPFLYSTESFEKIAIPIPEILDVFSDLYIKLSNS